MLDEWAVMQGMATAIGGLAGINQALPALPDSINPPTWGVVEVEVAYDLSMGGGAGMVGALFQCGLFVSRADDVSGRQVLAGYLANAQVKTALETDRTLGGVCKTLIVQRVRGAYRNYEIAGFFYLGAMFDVQVWE